MKKIASLTIAAALVFAGMAMAQDALTEHEVQSSLERQGYSKVRDLDFRNGVWTAKARSANGKSVSVRIDPRTGQAFPDKPVSRLSEADVRASLSTQGYTHVHDVDFDDGVWTAKADNEAGKKVRLQLDPETGRVIGSDRH
ncbi:PepSY domain-containing protein [Dyella jiangningensis]|uniref:Peptidase M4 n=1 Tax=Dyella jiangningensis TaxID=1379159 RepID=A0A328P796_9GAMM|nr:PepSY domain-containing protein [Dyella jiangningensis]RAO77193.1 peptidase M4 [Dyella jiangningensis]